ncbi:hypothetical protein DF223_13260 [Mycetocola zhujimingii]|uniref:Pyridoxamine 5'-phosphate oxidase family protein n=2 Tax=Mycetocola zhujimingii TaxID=2079792 RepID=A0A2U1TB46_9MICO|nr:hypothetical protein DF223_13260 [Mycetocola zhujimingii]
MGHNDAHAEFTKGVTMPTTELTEEHSMQLVADALVGRIVTAVGSVASIHPVSHTVVDGSIYFRTIPGDKLAALTVNAAVLFEADEIGEGSAWSVIVHGRARRLDDEPDELARISPQLRDPFIRGRRDAVVEVIPESISGRRFEPAEEDDDEVVIEPTD